MNRSEEILKDREARHIHLMERSRTYGNPIVCGRVNYPGVIKKTFEAEQAFEVLKKAMQKSLHQKVRLVEIWDGVDGFAFMMVIDEDAYQLKSNTVMIEEQHPLGRLFDIDVIDKTGKSVSRQSMKMEDRKCILCNAPALECMIERKHELAEVINKIHDCIQTYMKNEDN